MIRIFDFLYFLIRAVFLHVTPRRKLIAELEERLNGGRFSFTCCFSGRVSLYRAAKYIEPDRSRRVALVPDYICNAVHFALEKAGYKPQEYQTNEYLEPNPIEIKRMISENSGIGVLLTASVFGSDALLSQLNAEEFRRIIVERKIYVIVDLCQNCNLIYRLPANYGKYLMAVVSFNDKCFPGLMGGGIFSHNTVEKIEKKLPVSKLAKLYWLFLKKTLYEKGVRKYAKATQSIGSSSKQKYEYSRCVTFPYEIIEYRPAKIQIIMAVLGIRAMRALNEKRNKYAAKCPGVIKTTNYLSSPFLMISDGNVGFSKDRKIKGSYARHGNPDVSARQDLHIIHNKGFCDTN